MCESIEKFREYYADQFAHGMSEFLLSCGESFVRRLHSAAAKHKSTIYVFGNGGSHAISKCFEYAMQTYALSRGLPLRIQTGIDIHKTAVLADVNHSGTSFVNALKTEGADADDLVILISGSGDSDNLCEAAHYALHERIPILALLGCGGGRLGEILPATSRYVVPVNDQQISEDVIQSLSCFLSQPLENSTTWSNRARKRSSEIRKTISLIPEAFISNVSNTIVQTFFTRKFVWVLGLDHPALSVCAEHVAHNLYWDGIYEVSNPPPRLVFSSPTACDFSGISNDRRRDIVEILTGVSDLKEQGVALLYSMSANRPDVRSLLSHIGQLGIPGFLLFAEGQNPLEPASLMSHRTGLREPQLQALVSQILGHMLGRVIRLRLIKNNGSHANHDSTDEAAFLINYDLAQRRLLDA